MLAWSRPRPKTERILTAGAPTFRRFYGVLSALGLLNKNAKILFLVS